MWNNTLSIQNLVPNFLAFPNYWLILLFPYIFSPQISINKKCCKTLFRIIWIIPKNWQNPNTDSNTSAGQEYGYCAGYWSDTRNFNEIMLGSWIYGYGAWIVVSLLVYLLICGPVIILTDCDALLWFYQNINLNFAADHSYIMSLLVNTLLPDSWGASMERWLCPLYHAPLPNQ